MKQIIPTLLIAAVSFTACSDAGKGHAESTTTADTPAAAPAPAGATATKEIIDPICGMVKDDTWTDYSLYKGDTVWFCAAAEKTAFDANPEKYAANIKH